MGNMKRINLAGWFAVLIFPVVLHSQAGAPTTVNSWYELNEASDINSSDLGCYSPSAVSMAANAAVLTMTTGSFSCGYTGGQGGTGTTSQSYQSGSLMWHDLNIKPTAGHTIVVEVKAKMGRGWPAIWLLGGSKALNTGCQVSTPQSWDNTGTCAWDSDASDSAEIDIAEQTESDGYTSVSGHMFSSGGHSCSNINITDSTQNFHVYHIDWSTSLVHWAVDGTSGQSCNTQVPTHPMFLIIENRVLSGAAPPTGAFPTLMTIQYVQVCDAGPGTTCSTPGVNSGNTIFFDDFAHAGPAPPSGLELTIH